MKIKNIDCKYDIEINRKEIYPTIYEYTISEDYYFESCGTNYGNVIYARDIHDNHYVIRKKEKQDGTIHKEL